MFNMFNKRNNHLKDFRAPKSCSELEGEGADRLMACLPLAFLLGASNSSSSLRTALTNSMEHHVDASLLNHQGDHVRHAEPHRIGRSIVLEETLKNKGSR